MFSSIPLDKDAGHDEEEDSAKGTSESDQNDKTKREMTA